MLRRRAEPLALPLLDVAVNEEGPGIPEHEQAVLLEGEETLLIAGRTTVSQWSV